MQTNFQFTNLLGPVYKNGNLLFTPDGNSVISPIGNRVSVFDLVNNLSYTMPFENRSPIQHVALSPSGDLLLTICEEGGALLSSFHKRVVFTNITFREKVRMVKFSPDGKYFAVALGNLIQVWETPGPTKQYASLKRLREFKCHNDVVLSVDWSQDSKIVISGGADLTVRLNSIFPSKDDPSSYPKTKRPITMKGPRDFVIRAYMTDENTIYSVSRDGCITRWFWNEESKSWRVQVKHMLSYITYSADLHLPSMMLVLGFGRGLFASLKLPEFSIIQKLTVSRAKINSVSINPTGEWIAFGLASFGQLLVWEWQSERYIIKQTGHAFGMKCLAYGPQGRYIATGGEDGKLKIWKTDDGFCFVTFKDHTGPITGVEFTAKKQVVLSSSLDGTVRAFDLIRYRNFRTFTSPTPRQFSCLAVDPSGEIVAAGCSDSFEIYLWSMQTGRLLDVLEGHTGPISCLAFSTTQPHLFSGSWDSTAKMWDIFSGKKTHKDVYEHASDVLAIAVRPDGKQIATASIDGLIQIWDTANNIQVGFIDGRKDVPTGRALGSVTTSKSSSRSAFFNSLCYTADGSTLIAGGKTRFVCLYHVETRVLIRKFEITHNKALDGVLDKLGKTTEVGPMDLIDDRDEKMDIFLSTKAKDRVLPGVISGRYAGNKRQAIKVTSIRFSPSTRQWACCSTEGLLVYSLDGQLLFDPFQLDLDITPTTIYSTLKNKQYMKSLIMSLKLNEDDITKKVFVSIPFDLVTLFSTELHQSYVTRLLGFIARYLGNPSGTPHLEYCLHWTKNLFNLHGQYLRENHSTILSSLRLIQKTYAKTIEDLDKICSSNQSMLSYILSRQKQRELLDKQETTEENNTNKADDAVELNDTNLPGWY
eukprot:TRINITY_DN4548_c0_g1_i1.p1 TRINITY_DN4548_c0_g1~~TRINITY_DN4548_c0_g1_i1.p1  ORF type:complete len:872 (+),score=155.80 TRINITY_DN4548_c0_g1_i1:28-2643(+)